MSARAGDHRVLSVLFVRTVVVERMICPLDSASPFGDEPDEAEQFARPLAGRLGCEGEGCYSLGGACSISHSRSTIAAMP